MSLEAGVEPPLWDEGIREDVWEVWQKSGASVTREDLESRFRYDRREMADVNLRPDPGVEDGAEGRYADLSAHYRTDAARRLPDDWQSRAAAWKQRDIPVGMMFTRGVFQSLAVGNWRTLEPLMFALADRPRDVSAGMAAAAEVSCWAIDQVTSCVDLDFAILSEPVASFHAPVISPDHYRRFALSYYREMVDRLHKAGVDVIVTQAFGQVAVLIPLWLEIGVNAFWCSHTVPARMDYLCLRAEYGTDLRLIGGIDALSLAGGRSGIDEAVDRTVTPLLESGGYLPLLDDRVRPEVPFENYIHYRTKLERTVGC